ncbi:hypothetical protein CAP48_16160 [Advenella sp. S44]|uniref:hypothetical protein n=1 Tax=Advenella sp. S44 TaxID=1982755 RepID=UPI000C2ABB31|nr:hypothetical protein [Advenella sp. S44]PJX22431.1 hypothetical protein CAP48_16160 [Advenella sp. S44]
MSLSSDQANSELSVRKRSFQHFDEAFSKQVGSLRRWLMRGQNFLMEWIEASDVKETIAIESEYETLVLMPDTGGEILRENKPAVPATAGAACIVPAGAFTLAVEPGGRYAVIASSRVDLDMEEALNAEAYSDPDPRIDPIGTPYRRCVGNGEVQVLLLDDIASAADNPRLKIIQTQTLSINWVAYHGPRARSQLSPHRHANHEQGSLAIRGNFVHHLRVEWSKNADLWQDDEHCVASSPSLLVIPVNLVHTTEGVGEEEHILVDIFSPPRADFIAKGWVYNAGDYTRDE